MPTRNVVLTDRQMRLVDGLVACGRYQNASEVLRDGLRLIEQREQEQASRVLALREAVVVGVADIEAGRYTAHDDAASVHARVAYLARPAGTGG